MRNAKSTTLAIGLRRDAYEIIPEASSNMGHGGNKHNGYEVIDGRIITNAANIVVCGIVAVMMIFNIGL